MSWGYAVRSVVETRGEERVATRLAHIVVVQRLRTREPRALAGRTRFRETSRRRGREPAKRGARSRRVLLIPHRVRVAHRFAPVRHHVARIERLRLAERGRRLRIVEVVQIEHAAVERGVRSGRRRCRERDLSEPRLDARLRGVVVHVVVRATRVGHLLRDEGRRARQHYRRDDSGAKHPTRPEYSCHESSPLSASSRFSCANTNPSASSRRGTHCWPCSASEGSVPMRYEPIDTANEGTGGLHGRCTA